MPRRTRVILVGSVRHEVSLAGAGGLRAQREEAAVAAQSACAHRSLGERAGGDARERREEHKGREARGLSSVPVLLGWWSWLAVYVAHLSQLCHASTNVGSVQEESSESGRAFAMVHKAVETHGPEMFCMENVMNVLKDTPSGISDAEWVKRKFISIGYWCVYFVVANREHGGLPDRWRVWWVCARNLRGDVSAIDRFFLSVLASLKIPGELTSRDRYVILDDDERQEASQALGFEILKGSGPRRLKNTEKDEPGWKDSCLDLYEVFGLVWPPVYTDPRYKHTCVEGLLPREAATTLLYDIVWPMQAPLGFIDINPKLERVITSPKNFEEIAEKDLWSVDSSEVHLVGRGVAKQSPWRAFPGTIVGGSTLIVRSLKPRRTRALDAIEYMALMGWCREVWAKDVDRPDLGLGTQALQLAVVVSSHCVSVQQKNTHRFSVWNKIYISISRFVGRGSRSSASTWRATHGRRSTISQ